MGKKLDSIIGFFISAAVLSTLYLSISALSKYITSEPTPDLPDEVVIPPQEIPTDSSSSAPQIHTVSIIDKSYVVPTNPFDNEQYSKFPKVVVGGSGAVFVGSFEQVVLNIKGKVTSNEDVFLILNFNNQGGLVKAVRSSAKKLDIAATNLKGGIFNSNKPIDVSVNLLKDQLGTIASEFLKTGKGEREFNLLPKVQPNEAPVLAVIPFMNNGQYGGAEITSLDIEYVCQTGKECTVAPCAASKMVSECIQEELGPEAYKDLLKRHPEWLKK